MLKDSVKDTSAGSSQQTQSVIVPKLGPFQAGVLSLHVKEWENVTKDYISLQAIEGVEIPITKTPPLRLATELELSKRSVDPLVEENISMMLKLGAVKEIPRDSKGFFSRVFTVPKVERGKEYGRRFILNLKVSHQIYPTEDLEEPILFKYLHDLS